MSSSLCLPSARAPARPSFLSLSLEALATTLHQPVTEVEGPLSRRHPPCAKCPTPVIPIRLRFTRLSLPGIELSFDAGTDLLVGVAAALLVGAIDLLTQGREFGLLLGRQRTALG